MKVNDVKVGKRYLINGRILIIVANVNFLRTEPYLLLQGKIGGELKMYHSTITTIEEC